MMISTKGRYALRVMIDLAQHDEGYISLKDVAERQDISMKYLEMIVSILNKGKMLNSQRGKAGGYKLAKKPEEYTIGSILRLTEGSLAPVPCIEEDNEVECDKREECVTVILWKKINDAVNSVVDHTTLQDLVDWQREKNGDYII